MPRVPKHHSPLKSQQTDGTHLPHRWMKKNGRITCSRKGCIETKTEGVISGSCRLRKKAVIDKGKRVW